VKDYKHKKCAVLSSIGEHFPADAVDRIRGHAVRLKLRGGLPDAESWLKTDWTGGSAHSWIVERAREYAKERKVGIPSASSWGDEFEDYSTRSKSLAKLLKSKNGAGKSVVLSIDDAILREYGVPGNWVVKKDSVALVPSLLIESHILAKDLARRYAVSSHKPAVERRRKIASAKAFLRLAGFRGKNTRKEVAERFDQFHDMQYTNDTSLTAVGSTHNIRLEYEGAARNRSLLTLNITVNPESSRLRGKNCHKLVNLLKAVAEINR